MALEILALKKVPDNGEAGMMLLLGEFDRLRLLVFLFCWLVRLMALVARWIGLSVHSDGLGG